MPGPPRHSRFPWDRWLASFLLAWMCLAFSIRVLCHLVDSQIDSVPGASDQIGIGIILCSAGVATLVALRTIARR